MIEIINYLDSIMATVYNKFSEAYDELFLQNIDRFIRSHKEARKPNEYFITFYPSFGIKKDEKSDFLIIGQAVNGWGSGFNISESIEAATNDMLHEAVNTSNRFLDKRDHSPIDWVNVCWTKSLLTENRKDALVYDFYSKSDYVAYRSFFWNVAFKVVTDYYNLDRGEGWEWAKKLVWSNLYKIAPEDRNPNDEQIEWQQELSIELLKKEIDELSPKFCIILTNGSWWWPFQKGLKTQGLDFGNHLSEIQSFEKYKNTKIIVTTRPFSGNGEEHVTQILELLRS